MFKLTRISIAASLLLALFSLPLWLPSIYRLREGSTESIALPPQAQAPDSKHSSSSPGGFTLPAMTLVDMGWMSASASTQQFIHPPAIVRWDPAQDVVDWRLETGPINGVYLDDEGRIYFLEQRKLTILNGQNGEVLSRIELQDVPADRPDTGPPIPVGRQGNRLFLRNYALMNNLSAHNLQNGALEEQWSLCKNGYPFDSFYQMQENTFITFCIDFNPGMQGFISRLSLDSGTSAEVEIPVLGAEGYMTGNGFALGPGNLAYVVDSDAGALVEIDLEAMQILRQTKYQHEEELGGWLPRAVSWLSGLTASPAQAKRWMSRPAISPDGRYLVVDGGFGAGGGETNRAWLVDLENLEAIEAFELPRSPQAFHFASERLLYILLQTDEPGDAQVVAVDLDRGQSIILDIPSSGQVERLLP